MAAFHNSGGRRAPNVSQYIANLNAIPSAHELTTTTTTTSQHDHSTNSNTFIDDDLAIFTNTEFFDFDLGSEDIEHDGNTIISYDPSQEERARRENAAAAHKKSMAGMDFDNAEYTYANMTSFLPSASISTGLPHAFDVSNPTTSYANSYPAAPAPPPSAHSDSMSPTSPTAADTPTSRLAAEEDKRRRNTAASARFRVKKKQREQALERQAKDLADKTKALEDKVVKLETENEWLRGLVVERDGRDRLDEGVEGWRRKHREEKGKEKEKAPETAEV